MPRAAVLKRKAFFVDETALRRARKALGAGSDAEVITLLVDRIAEMEKFWRFMRRSRRVLTPGSFRALGCGQFWTRASTSVTGRMAEPSRPAHDTQSKESVRPRTARESSRAVHSKDPTGSRRGPGAHP